jgi:glycosyltransferase involved in cell wall biosynthesis
MSCLVSVVIPAYNAENFIDETLWSARNQDYRNLEIIVIDDGSTDGTGEIVCRHAADDPRIRLVRTPNGGVARARNRGTEEATGRYIAYLDADDIWHPTKISLQVAALEAHRSDPTWAAVYTSHRKIDLAGRVIGSASPWSARGYILARHIVFKFIGNGSSIMVRRDVALAVGGFDPSYADAGIGGAEDLDFELRISSDWKIEVVDRHLVGYRVYSGNMSSNARRMSASVKTIVRRHLENNRDLPETVRTMAQAAALQYSVAKLLASRELLAAARDFLALVLMSPSAVGWMLFNGSLSKARRLALKSARLIGLAGSARSEYGRAFLDLAVDRRPDTARSWRDHRDRRRLARLARIDRNARRARKPGVHPRGTLSGDEIITPG